MNMNYELKIIFVRLVMWKNILKATIEYEMNCSQKQTVELPNGNNQDSCIVTSINYAAPILFQKFVDD